MSKGGNKRQNGRENQESRTHPLPAPPKYASLHERSEERFLGKNAVQIRNDPSVQGTTSFLAVSHQQHVKSRIEGEDKKVVRQPNSDR